MTQRSVVHATFVIDRTFTQPPARVFAAFARPELKKRWFSGPPEWGPDEHAMDFRVGGVETSSGGPRGGPVHAMRSIYQDIVPDQRIIYSYDMHLDDARISVSLGTIELYADGKGTRMVLTEQGAFLDGHDYPAQREEGYRGLMDALARSLDAS